jgi:outer membrane protein TolC
MAEGAFAAGAGSALDWDNRWDLGLQARWDLTGPFTSRSRQRIIESKREQAHLTQQDLHGKLTAGVREAQSATRRHLEQLRATREQIQHAKQAFLDAKDLTSRREPQNRSYGEVLQALRAWKEAEYNQLVVLSGYDKAQLRLLLLLGPASGDKVTR